MAAEAAEAEAVLGHQVMVVYVAAEAAAAAADQAKQIQAAVQVAHQAVMVALVQAVALGRRQVLAEAVTVVVVALALMVFQ